MENKPSKNQKSNKGVTNLMMDLKFSPSFLSEAEEKKKKLRDALKTIEEKIADFQKQREEIVTTIQGLEYLTGKSNDTFSGVTSESVETFAPLTSKNLANVSLKTACLEVLRASNHWMSSKDVMKALEKAGRRFESPNARDMVGQALRESSKLLDRRRNGLTVLYRFKRDLSSLIDN